MAQIARLGAKETVAATAAMDTAIAMKQHPHANLIVDQAAGAETAHAIQMRIPHGVQLIAEPEALLLHVQILILE
jgi:hypothetical protein